MCVFPTGSEELKTPLTNQQKKMITNSWKAGLREDQVNTGRKLFLDIFKIRPDLMTLFEFKDTEKSSLNDSPLLTQHAILFMDVIGNVIDNLDSFEAVIEPRLLQLGANHVEIQGFDEEYFAVLKQQLNLIWRKRLKSVVGAGSSYSMIRAWQHMFAMTIGTLIKGYLLQKANKLDRSETNVDSVD